SKMRFISAQYVAYLTDDLWKKNALNSNNMGSYLAKRLSEELGIKLVDGMYTNIIFAYMEKDLIKDLQEEFDFYIWDESQGLIRLVTSFDTSKEDVDKFIDAIKEKIE